MPVNLFYYLILFFLFALACVENLKYPLYKQRFFLYLVISAILVTFCGLRPLDYDRDIGMYRSYFDTFCSYSYAEVLLDSPHRVKEFGYIYLNKLFCNVGFRALLLTCAILGLGLKVYFIKKRSQMYVTALFLYVAMFFPLREFTQIRDAISASFLIAALFTFYQRDFWKSFLLFLLACSFHLVALIYLPVILVIWMIRKERYWDWIMLGGFLLFFIKPTDYIHYLAFLPDQITNYNVIIGKGSVLMLVFLFVVLIFYKVSKLLYKLEDKEMEFYAKLTCIALFCGLATFYHPVLSRLANALVFFSILLLVRLLLLYNKFYFKIGLLLILILVYYLGVRNFNLVTEFI